MTWKNLDTEQKRMDEARRHYEEALKVLPSTGAAESGRISARLADTLNNLGKLDRRQNRIDDARQHYEGALRLPSTGSAESGRVPALLGDDSNDLGAWIDTRTGWTKPANTMRKR